MNIPTEYIIELGMLRVRNECANCHKKMDLKDYHIQLCKRCRNIKLSEIQHGMDYGLSLNIPRVDKDELSPIKRKERHSNSFKNGNNRAGLPISSTQVKSRGKDDLTKCNEPTKVDSANKYSGLALFNNKGHFEGICYDEAFTPKD